ncbi:ion channel protein [Nonomuraea sp. NPDC050790]|uniref:ion channel protein n=1 Tax=Nonomuraea sp. NPDC050790 TaxID=3364371 RepID=UPI0037A38B31
MTHGRPAAALARLALPALVVGVACSLILMAVSFAAEALQEVLWHHLPAAMGLNGASPWWTLTILTLTGLAVGLVVWKIPTGPDPATEGLVGEPLPMSVVPGMLLATALTLAGGVSLGPENPITAANIALAVALGVRLLPGIKAPTWLGLAAAGTIGALFGTPVAAALILSELALGPKDVPLWDRLFAPLVAAGAGAITTVLVTSPVFHLGLPEYSMRPLDLLTGMVIACVAVLAGLAAVYAFPHVHRLFHRVRHPVLRLTLAGVLLGVAGMIGGQITLFKGLEEMKELAADHGGAASLTLIIVVKLVALLIASTSAFIGGRIFPAVFVGVAVGLLASALVPGVPTPLSVACGVLGMTLAVTQQGWLSLFMAAAVVTDLELIPVLCLALLPAWLLVTGRPQMIIEAKH